MFLRRIYNTHPDFGFGVRQMLPQSLGISAWGLMTGVAMVKSGMSVVEALAMALRELSDCGARFMLSQSDTPGARDIYRDNRGWNTTVLTVSRSISSKASTRGDVTELVVRNYTQ